VCSRFLRALFQFGNRTAGEAAKFGRSGVELLGVVSAARLERGKPAAKADELIWRQLDNSFGDFFNFHGGAHYSTAAAFSFLGISGQQRKAPRAGRGQDMWKGAATVITRNFAVAGQGWGASHSTL